MKIKCSSTKEPIFQIRKWKDLLFIFDCWREEVHFMIPCPKEVDVSPLNMTRLLLHEKMILLLQKSQSHSQQNGEATMEEVMMQVPCQLWCPKKPSEKSFGIKIQRLWHKPIYLSSPCLIPPAQTEFPNGAISAVPLANPLFRSHHPHPTTHAHPERRPPGKHGRVAWWEALASWCWC